MKNTALSYKFLFLCFCCYAGVCRAQVTTIPRVLQKGYMGEVTIVFNPNEGNKGMVGASACYAHTGITYNGSSWQKTGTWRNGSEKYKMTKNTDGCWELKITPNIYEYYGVPTTTPIEQLCFVFNDGPNGKLEGKAEGAQDIFVNLADSGLSIVLYSPTADLVFANDSLHIEASISENSHSTVLINNDTLTQITGSEIDTTIIIKDAGTMTITIQSYNGKDSTELVKQLLVTSPSAIRALPPGIELGINYDTTDYTKATLCTYAAGCVKPNDPSVLAPAKTVFVIGDFNNWTIDPEYQMFRDSCHFWLPIEELEPGKEYAFQYVVVRSDGMQKKVSDGFANKMLHPKDKELPQEMQNNFKPYPEKGDDYVSILQTNQPKYTWDSATLNFVRPKKENLIIYELWVYDYTAERNFAGLIKRLDYLQNLGVNAIELMPVSEFEGNDAWGYSPTHYFAVDKAYGTNDQFRELIDSIHSRGMAVIMDMVFNHATGLNPQNKLYPYGDDLKYNPWFNTSAPHSDNVYEDWNHDFEQTHKMFIRCLQYWLKEFKVDGFRMDLSFGFCGKTYNAMTNIVDYYKKGILAVDSNAYFILEHWGSNMGTERQQLIEQGMPCWHDISDTYAKLACGNTSDTDVSEANRKGYVSYCECHDKERLFYIAKKDGIGGVKDYESVRLNRVPLVLAFNVLLAGPHLLWQYIELGYDYSINSKYGTNAISEDNRTSIKERPDHLGWFNAKLRMDQYVKTAQIIRLRTQCDPEIFDTIPISAQLGSEKIKTVLWQKNNKKIFIAGNFSAETPETVTVPTGIWHDYFSSETLNNQSVTLSPGQLLILTSEQYQLPQITTSLPDLVDITNHLTSKQSQTSKVLKKGKVFIQNDKQVFSIDGKRK